MTLYKNAHIITQNPNQANARAFVVEDGKFMDIGDDNLIEKYTKEARQIIDLEGKTIIPGFIDAHIHIWKVGSLITHILDVRGMKSIEEIKTALKEFDKKNPTLVWIVARGFNESSLVENRMPTAADLDEVSSEKPIFLQRTCAHIAVVNSKGLAISGIDNQTISPIGGEIRLDKEGKLTGILCETAMGLATKHFPPYSFEDYFQMTQAAGNELLAAGVTFATDPAVAPDLLAAYIEMDKQNLLPFRLSAIPILLPDGGAEPFPLPKKYTSDFLRIDTVKFFSDGGLSGKTAALKKPYKNTSDTGILRLDERIFEHLAFEAHSAGFRIATHAIGDEAIELVINTYKTIERRLPKNLSHRIEHLGVPDIQQLTAIIENDFWVVTQPIFIKELGKNFRMYLDDAYLKRCYPYNTQLRLGVKTAFSSDAPVVKDFRPLSGIQAAVLRQDATGEVITENEKISIKEALKAYTIDAATANGVAHQVGSIEAGKFADFVVLDKNILESSAEELDKITILATYIGGKRVYKR